MRDDGLGGPHHRNAPDAYAELRIAILAWRLRLCGSATAVVFVIAGESVGLLFVVATLVVAILFAAGSSLASLEMRIKGIRQERRR